MAEEKLAKLKKEMQDKLRKQSNQHRRQLVQRQIQVDNLQLRLQAAECGHQTAVKNLTASTIQHVNDKNKLRKKIAALEKELLRTRQYDKWEKQSKRRRTESTQGCSENEIQNTRRRADADAVSIAMDSYEKQDREVSLLRTQVATNKVELSARDMQIFELRAQVQNAATKEETLKAAASPQAAEDIFTLRQEIVDLRHKLDDAVANTDRTRTQLQTERNAQSAVLAGKDQLENCLRKAEGDLKLSMDSRLDADKLRDAELNDLRGRLETSVAANKKTRELLQATTDACTFQYAEKVKLQKRVDNLEAVVKRAYGPADTPPSCTL